MHARSRRAVHQDDQPLLLAEPAPHAVALGLPVPMKSRTKATAVSSMRNLSGLMVRRPGVTPPGER
jgi:hypothetical protein